MSTTSMTTTSPTSRATYADAHRPALLRLTRVELRKLVDTPSGIALVAAGALLAGVFGGGAALFLEGPTFGAIARMAGTPGTMLLPVLTILLVTSERHHRTALTTYALVPTRRPVLGAKALAVVALGLVTAALSLAAAAMIVPVGSFITDTSIPWTIEWSAHLWLTAGIVLAGLSGFAVGLLTGNAPAALSIVLAWPVVDLLMSVVPEVATALSWVDINAVLTLADGIAPVDVARVLTGIAVWIVLPGVLGMVRELTTEVR